MTRSRILEKLLFLNVEKRTKFVITSILLAAGFAGVSFVGEEIRFISIGALGLATTLLFSWSLAEGLTKSAVLLVLVLPSLFTLAVGLFWFLLPATLLTLLPVVALYGIGIYALGLISNIYIVSTVRTIALLRAAKGVGFVLTLFTSFLLFDAVISLKASLLQNVVLIVLSAFPLFVQGLWSGKPSRTLSKEIIYYSILFSFSTASVASLLYFWPVTVVIGSLFLTVGMYVLLGLGQAKMEGRLFFSTIREYVLVGIIVFVAMVVATSWR